MKNKKFVAAAVSAALVASVVAPIASEAATGQATTKTSIKDVRLYSATKAKVYYTGANGKTTSKDVALSTPVKHLSTYAVIPMDGKNIRWNFNERVQLPQQKSYAKYIALAKTAVAAGNADKAAENLEIAKAHLNNMNAAHFSASTLANYKASVATVEEQVAGLQVANVTEVKAVDGKTLQLTGTALNKLTAADITVSNNTVAAITPAADGKTATVTVGTYLTPKVEYTVTVKEASFKVTFALTASSIQVTEATYDDDRANQYVAFTVNGAVGNVNDLVANGYTIQFSAVDKDGNAANIFENTTTGKLNTNLTADTKYKVQVTLTNGTDVIVSAQQEIAIQNLDLAISAINSYEFTRGSVVQNSTNLVVGETGSFTSLKVMMDGSEKKITSGVTVESSNPAVASVDAAGVVTAHAPGSVTLTVAYGSVKKQVAFTVVNEARELTSAKVMKQDTDTQIYNVTGVKGTNTIVKVVPVDQYGDPVAATLTVESTDATIASLGSASLVVPAAGEADLTITNEKAGSATILVKKPNKQTLTTLAVNVTENTYVASKKWEIIDPKDDATKSADNTLDLSADSIVEYKFNQYNTENVALGAVTLTGYQVASSNSSVATAAVAGEVLTITGVKKGIATISITDAAGVNVGTITVTVQNNAVTITSATFKALNTINYAQTVDFKSFLNYEEAATGKDPIIKGLTLNKSTTNAVRLNVSSSKLYLDTNGDAVYTSGTDADLGSIALEATTDSTNLTVSSNQASVVVGSKGTLVFKVLDAASTPKIISSTSVKVDVANI